MALMYNSVIGVNKNRNNVIDVENGKYDGTVSTCFVTEIVKVLEKCESKRILALITYNIIIIYCLCIWITSTNSIALSAYAITIVFNVCALFICLISIWVEQKSLANRNFHKYSRSIPIFENLGSAMEHVGPSISRLSNTSGYPEYCKNFDTHLQVTSFGHFGHKHFFKNVQNDDRKFNEKFSKYETAQDEKNVNFNYELISSLGLEKYEVRALLVSSCLSLMVGSLVSVELVARLRDQPKVYTERLGLGALLGFLAHLGTIIGYPDAGLKHVVCKALPCPTLRGWNPILGGNIISALILSATHLVIHFWKIDIIDTAAAFAILGLTGTSMLPLAFYTSHVIFWKLPRHMSEQLDKCLHEALIIDGVIEFRNERFWTKSFGKLAGTLQVRIRRNANENRVLESVMLRLSKIVSSLKIQEFHESDTSDILNHLPVDYYVNEILSPNKQDIDDGSSCRTNHRTSRQEIELDARVAKIEDIIGSEESQIKIFAVKSEKTKIMYDRINEGRGNINGDLISSRKLTIFQNDNVSMKDRLWRGEFIHKNALLYGTNIDFEKCTHFFVP